MRSRRSIIIKRSLVSAAAMAVIAIAVVAGAAQRTALVVPNDTPLDRSVAKALEASGLRIQDMEMTAAAFAAVNPGDPFNMTSAEAKRVGSAVGSDLFVLIKAGTQRRATTDGPDKFESFAVVYVVQSRSGLLGLWKVISADAATPDESKSKLIRAVESEAAAIAETARTIFKEQVFKEPSKTIEDVPQTDSPGFRPPVPYRRLKPEYTRIAYLYDITATVEATVELDERGQIISINVTRWAGYGLDESVIAAIRSMNWRPAERGGKPLPIRFLLRYNFKKLDKDDPDNE